ncbi:2-hydroxyacyl-CoA dehydratase subunit D [Natranaerofaba carboxydovora]|uniref:2-hydroxyacyl-CoA dehydratase subunit D n=1 Tax=Natranaerofaba carboxydovora TaxID=2742683 RepID=UPI001F13737E|nr:2-hydroxyacyl-CoA dehydratase family protein [Natranaerofaba carboxydovora]UMZ73126.1 (R)-phenyllactyl-CoA dehydratase alpha subunit [Natranaerofaba carboxydovora]
MDPIKHFKNKLGENLSRKLLSSPRTYELANFFFVKHGEFPFKGIQEVTNMMLDLTASAYRQEKRVAFTSAFFPDELIHAFDFVPFSPEVAAATATSLDISPSLLKKAEQEEISPDGCSFHRVAATGAFEDYFPIPDVFLASSHLCDGAPQLFRYLAEIYDKPYYILDVPVTSDKKAKEYVASQLKEITQEIEKITGNNLIEESLEEKIHISNKARKAQLEFYEARKNPTKYLSGENAITLVLLHFLGQGHPKTPEVFRTLTRELIAPAKDENYQITRNNVDEELNGSLKIIWSHLRPFYKNNLFEILEELNAKVVFEEMNYVYWPELDPGKPYLSLAEKVLSNPMVGPIEKRADSLKQMVEDYNSDGIIHFSHWGCHPTIGAVYNLKKILQKDNIPFLSIDSDCVDKGKFSEGQLRTRLESFIEMV